MNGITFINFPEKSNWRCEVLKGVIWTPDKGKEPNAFHRLMQELVFGVKWTKTNATKAD